MFSAGFEKNTSMLLENIEAEIALDTFRSLEEFEVSLNDFKEVSDSESVDDQRIDSWRLIQKANKRKSARQRKGVILSKRQPRLSVRLDRFRGARDAL